MKLKNTKTNKEYVIIAFLTITDKKDFKLFDIRELEDYILTEENGTSN